MGHHKGKTVYEDWPKSYELIYGFPYMNTIYDHMYSLHIRSTKIIIYGKSYTESIIYGKSYTVIYRKHMCVHIWYHIRYSYMIIHIWYHIRNWYTLPRHLFIYDHHIRWPYMINHMCHHILNECTVSTYLFVHDIIWWSYITNHTWYHRRY